MINVREIIVTNVKYIRPAKTVFHINPNFELLIVGEYFITDRGPNGMVCLSSLPEIRGGLLE